METFSPWSGLWKSSFRRETPRTAPSSPTCASRQPPAGQQRREALDAGFTPDAVLTDVEEALDALGQLTGRTAREEIVSGIFSRFCVGK